MAIYKCKVCGETLVLSEGVDICECTHCGAIQTAPFVGATPAETSNTQNNSATEQYYFGASNSPVNNDLYRNIEADSGKENTAHRISYGKFIVIFMISVLIAALIAAVLIVTIVLPKVKYDKAIEMMNNGAFNEAYEMFVELEDYKDSSVIKYECKYRQATEAFEEGNYELAKKIFSELEEYEDSKEMAEKSQFMLHKTALSKAEVGNVVQFGAYEQDNNEDNGKEVIDWLVLDIRGNSALLISVHALDSQKYNNRKVDSTWASSSIRGWLNDRFYNNAFSADYQDLILPTNVKAYDNPIHGTTGGTNTTDNIFLLSYNEAKTYFRSDAERIATPTEYASARGVESKDTPNCWWWLRTPGIYNIDVCGVHDDGAMDDLGCYVDSRQAGVRPAMWVAIPE